MNLLYFFASFVVFTKANCANILLLQQVPGKSHYILVSRLAKALASRGHNTTIVSPFKQEKPIPNLREIELPGVIEAFREKKERMMINVSSGTAQLFMVFFFRYALVEMAEVFLAQNFTKKLLHPSEKFDLIIMEKFGEEPFTGFSYYFNAPYILLSTLGSSSWTNGQVGNPGSPSYVSNLFIPMSNEMGFFERVLNTLLSIPDLVTDELKMLRMEKLLHEHFPGAPSLTDLYYNVSLYLMNSHPSYGKSVPVVQNMIDIGGFHVEEPKPLPKELQFLLDNATEGAIYFSMGSNLQGTDLPLKSREAIIKVFSKLKQTVIWKFEDPTLENVPPNVKIGKWFPQQDILAHPNLKLFISHGGLLSTTEAIYHGVPIIGIPAGADQPLNVQQAVRDGYALHVPFNNINEETLGSAIKEMLYNPKYRNNIEEKSRLFHDRPMKPIDTAIYWIEYVIRHRGAPHLKSVTTKLRWYEITLLDVGAFLLLCAYLVVKVIKITIKTLCCRNKKINDSEKKKKD